MGRKKIEVKCSCCGRMFDRDISEHKRSVRLNRSEYCSKECLKKGKSLSEKNCEFCGKPFMPDKSVLRFCSKSCANKNRGERGDETRQRIAESNSARYDEDKRLYYLNPKRCKLCNTVIEWKKRNKVRYCSRSCAAEDKAGEADELTLYRRRCAFTFSVKSYPDWFDLSIIEKYGWYSAANRGGNLDGVSRDHMISVYDGFRLGISSNKISHPANCKLMTQRNNSVKNRKSTITVSELDEKIKLFEDIYGEYGVIG
jgi:endogenous inhibitor of DNA gyrase (YacG/DUF329 family)